MRLHNENMQEIITRNRSQRSWNARQHQFNLTRKFSWSIFINFGENSLLECVSQPKIAKNTLNTPFWGSGVSRSSMLVLPERSSALLVMISSTSVSICNRSHARLVYSSRNRQFWTGYPNLLSFYTEDSLNPGGRNLHCETLRLMLKISYADCLGLSQVISAQFTLEMCVAAWKKIH